MSEEFKRASVCLTMHPNPYQTSDPKTVVCFGMPRGGTSAVAGVLQYLGVFLGDNLENNHEDPDFCYKKPPHMKQVIRERNETHGLWGWKFPAAANYMPRIFDSIRNTVFVIVFRDAVATSKAHARWYKKDVDEALDEYLIAVQKNIMVARRLGAPTLMVSYEKLMAYPLEGAQEMAEFLGVALPEDSHDKVRQFLVPGEYKSMV